MVRNSGIVSTVLADSSSAWDGSALPPYPEGKPEVKVLEIEIAPGATLAPHTHPVINAGVVLEGDLTVIALDGQERTFHTGEAIVEMVGRPHYGENRGMVPVRLVMFYAATASLPLSVPVEEG